VDLVGRVASASAGINQRYLPKPHFSELMRLSEDVGAAGLQVAHSGTVAGLLFDPRRPELEARVGRAEHGLDRLGISDRWRFRAGGKS
jgi:uncharacterized protein involved in propanediol utilization